MNQPHPYKNRLRIALNAFSAGTMQLLSLTLLVWMHQYLLRRVSPEEYALYPLCASLMIFAPLLSGVFTTGISRFLVEADARETPGRMMEIASTMQMVVALVAVVMMAIGLWMCWNVELLLGLLPSQVPDARRMLALLVSAAAIRLLLTPQSTGLVVRQHFVAQNAIELAFEIARLGLLFGLLKLIGPRVLWVVVSSVASSVGQQVVLVLVSRRLMPELRFRPSAVRMAGVRSIMVFGGWSYVANMAYRVSTALPALLLAHFGQAIQVSCFHLGSIVPRQIQNMGRALRSPLQPVLTGLIARGETRSAGEVYLRIGRYMLWFVLLPSVPLLVFAPRIVVLYAGSLYAPAVTVVVCLLLASALTTGNASMPQLAMATGQVRAWALRVVAVQSVFAVVALALVAGRGMGATGAAIAALVAAVADVGLFGLPFGLRLAGVSFRRWLREAALPGVMPALLTGLFLCVLRFQLTLHTWKTIGLATACASVLYGAVVCLCVHQDDKRELQIAWRRVRVKLGMA